MLPKRKGTAFGQDDQQKVRIIAYIWIVAANIAKKRLPTQKVERRLLNYMKLCNVTRYGLVFCKLSSECFNTIVQGDEV